MITLTNSVGVVAIIALAMLGASFTLGEVASERKVVAALHVQRFERIKFEDGSLGLRDASGYVAPLREYRRILSGSTVADGLLLDLAEPDRVVALTEYGARAAERAYRYSGKRLLRVWDDLEQVIALKPDLVIVNTHRNVAKSMRLRDAGLVVFDLGEMRGLDTFLPNIRAVAELLGERARGETYSKMWLGRLRRIASGIPEGRRRSGIYLSMYGTKLYGSGRGTSFYDVLRHAGVVDIAAKQYRGWPQYSVEQVLALDPEVIVSRSGMQVAICRTPGLSSLRACRNSGAGFVELPEPLISDAGAGMLRAAELIHEALYTDQVPKNAPQ